MTQVELLAQQIAQLDDASFSKLRDWFLEFDQVRWDKKLEADSNAGKLDFLINAALAEHEAGLTRDLWNIKRLLASGLAMKLSLWRFVTSLGRTSNC